MKKRVNRGRQQRKKLRHVSLFAKRDQFNRLERIFHERWQAMNVPRPGLNGGWGLLQNLLLIPLSGSSVRGLQWYEGDNRAFILNQRDATIAATIVQWLGTNFGYYFIKECLEKDGYEIREMPNRRENLPPKERMDYATELLRQPLPPATQIVREIKRIPQGRACNLYGWVIRNDSWSQVAGLYICSNCPHEKLTAVQIAKRMKAAEAGRAARRIP